ncbi:hypothetical protein DBR06_SOUSAS2010181, partial [Sousa chinensis]
ILYVYFLKLFSLFTGFFILNFRRACSNYYLNFSKTPSFHMCQKLMCLFIFPHCYSSLVGVSQAYFKRHRVTWVSICQLEMLFHFTYNS